MSDRNETYLRWLAQRWDEHKADTFYGSTEHEDRRTGEVLDMLEDIRKLSERSIGSTRARVGRGESRGGENNERSRMGGSEGRRGYYEGTSTREEARKEEVLEVFRGLSALARQRFRAY